MLQLTFNQKSQSLYPFNGSWDNGVNWFILWLRRSFIQGKTRFNKVQKFWGFFRRYFWGISVLYNTLYQVRVIERFTVPVLGRDFYTAFQVDSNYICACANCYVFEHDGMVYRKKLVYLTINRRVGHPAIRKNSGNMYVWFFIMRNNVLALQSSTKKQFLVSLSIPPNIHIVYSISCVVFTFSKFALINLHCSTGFLEVFIV